MPFARGPLARGALTLTLTLALALALALGLGLGFGFTPARASQASAPQASAPQACPTPVPSIHVFSASDEDRRFACEGAADAIAFFRAHDLKLPPRIRIHITTEFPPGPSASAAGCFIEEDTIYLVPYAKLRSFKTWFKRPVSRATYRSLSTHEVAHALAHCNFSVAQPNIRAKEYIAYVAMFATMDPELRTRVLAAYPEAGFESADRLTALLYMFDPMKFGVESFRHFSRNGDGPAFLREVLAGRQMAD